MREPVKVVAILAASPALSSILAAVLAATPNLRVRVFESPIALQTYMRLSPVDLLVSDFDSDPAPADSLAGMLRLDERVMRREFQIIALAGRVTAAVKQASIGNGIDEVIVKPMSPKYLLERVLSRLKQPAPQITAGPYQGPERRGRLAAAPAGVLAARRLGDNVIPLFRDR
ncbi:MAG TPA: hypothetical protein VL418_18475 [Devosiaceae bacterium]|jgi:DNA-binding response OmpR family regulator|nr:hypothetical protein [Devosiaceae bacterium]